MYEATHSKPVAYLQQGISPAKYLLCPATKRAEPIQINGSIISRPRLYPASCLLDSVESSYAFKILNNTLHIHATVAVHAHTRFNPTIRSSQDCSNLSLIRINLLGYLRNDGR